MGVESSHLTRRAHVERYWSASECSAHARGAAGGWSLACWTGAGRWPPPPNGFRLMPRRSVSGATDSLLRVMPGCGTGRAGPVVHRTARLRRSAGGCSSCVGSAVGVRPISGSRSAWPLRRCRRSSNASGVGRLDQGDRATHTPKLPAQRYQRERPGELIHVDVKKLGGIPSGGGGGPGDGATPVKAPRPGWSGTGTCTRLSTTGPASCTRRSSTTNKHPLLRGSGPAPPPGTNRSDSRRAGHHRQRALLPLGTVAPGMRRDRDHREQDPALPAPNKRQDRAIPPDPLREWAYIRPWTSETQRARAYTGFVHFYNHHRSHGALGWATPTSILKDNLPAIHT